jgi:hypothetical protein
MPDDADAVVVNVRSKTEMCMLVSVQRPSVRVSVYVRVYTAVSTARHCARTHALHLSDDVHTGGSVTHARYLQERVDGRVHSHARR